MAGPDSPRRSPGAPRLRADRVPRPRLVDHLQAAAAAVVAVIAQAGAGKTTAVMDWIEATDRPFAWVGVRDQPEAHTALLARVATALEPTVGVGRLAGLAGSGDDVDPPLAASALAEDLAAADEGFVLVVEDLHRVADPTASETLRELIPLLPANATLAVTSRSDPPFPLARLRAEGALVELRSSDLAFTSDEARDLIAAVADVDLTDDQVARLDQRLEGWAAGLQLAGLSLGRSDDPDAFVDEVAGDEGYVAEYLVEEVLDREPEDVQRFLMETASLGEIDVDLAAAATGESRAADLIDEIARRNLFLLPIEGRPGWYRYHHLFADLLTARLRRIDPDRATAVLVAAADRSEATGDIDASIDLHLAAGDSDGALAVMQRNAEHLLTHGEMGRLRDWIARFPPDVAAANPQLLLGSAWIALFTTRADDAVRHLDQIERIGTESFAPFIDAQISIMRGMAAWLAGDHDTATSHVQSALDVLPPDNRNLPTLAHLYLGRAALGRGDVDTAVRELETASTLGTRAGNLSAALSARTTLSSVALRRGDLTAARHHAETANDLTEAGTAGGHSFPVGGVPHLVLGVVDVERFDLDAAVESFRRGLVELRRTTFLDWTVLGYRRWAEAESLRGRHAEAADVLAEARRHLSEFGAAGTRLARALADAEVRALVRAGSLDAAQRAFAEVAPSQLERPGEFAHPAFDHLSTSIRLDLALARGDAASEAIDRLHVLVGDHVGLRIRALVLDAAAALAVDRVGRATAALDEALGLAAPSGWVRPFLDSGSGVVGILPKTDPDPVRSSLIARIRELAPEPEAPAPRHQPIPDPLTPRELEVLDEIAAGMTNAQIAERLYISVGTTKRHVANIFLKLAVSHRAEAIATARSLGIID